VVLVKPQFEAGREHVGKGGVVRDDAARLAAVDGVATWAHGVGLVEIRSGKDDGQPLGDELGEQLAAVVIGETRLRPSSMRARCRGRVGLYIGSRCNRLLRTSTWIRCPRTLACARW